MMLYHIGGYLLTNSKIGVKIYRDITYRSLTLEKALSGEKTVLCFESALL